MLHNASANTWVVQGMYVLSGSKKKNKKHPTISDVNTGRFPVGYFESCMRKCSFLFSRNCSNQTVKKKKKKKGLHSVQI